MLISTLAAADAGVAADAEATIAKLRAELEESKEKNNGKYWTWIKSIWDKEMVAFEGAFAKHERTRDGDSVYDFLDDTESVSTKETCNGGGHLGRDAG